VNGKVAGIFAGARYCGKTQHARKGYRLMIRELIVSWLGPNPPFALLIAAILSGSALYFLARYFLIAGAGWGVSSALARFAPHRRLQKQPFTGEQIRREIFYSSITSLVFSLIGAGVYFAGKAGYTQVYRDVSLFGWTWFWLSIPVMLAIHDFYFYWMHRLIHHQRLFERVHRTHHLSTNPSPWAAFAFHPLEAVLEAMIIVIIAIIMPVHIAALSIFALLSLVYNVYGHLGYEVMPRALAKSALGRLFNKSAYHNHHHRAFRANYGLYTTIWDRLFGTFDERSEAIFDRATIKADAQPQGAPA
jgi:sterol desaturase/sphingolipid hydroxylase (fatty acid hydroxylase superfamily)